MPQPPLLADLALILVAAALAATTASAVRAPKIVGYIAAGLVLGPATGLLSVTEAVDLMAEVGIALLLFLVGLELSFEKVREVGRVVVLAGLAQVAATLVVGLGLGWLLGLPLVEALVLALALTFSSTVVVVKILDQRRELDARYGRISVGILLVQDVVVVVALTVMAGLGRTGSVDASEVARGLLLAFAGMAALLGVALAAARWLLPPVFGWMSRQREGLFIWSLCWCFLFILGAESLHLSLEVGAFLAGISVAQLPYNHDLRRRVHPLMNFFIAVFFVLLGARMDLGAAAGAWREGLLLSAFVLVGKPLLFLWILPRLGEGERDSLWTGITLSQISEFSFILAAMALSGGLIGDDLLALIGLVGLITISASTVLMALTEELTSVARRSGLTRLFGADRPGRVRADEGKPLTGHVVVAGMNALGRRLVRELHQAGERVLAVDVDPAKLADLPTQTLVGSVDREAVLEEANVQSARLVISALQIEDTNNLLAYRCRELGVPCSIHAFHQSVVRDLEEIGADHLIVSKNAGMHQLAAALRQVGIIGS